MRMIGTMLRMPQKVGFSCTHTGNLRIYLFNSALSCSPVGTRLLTFCGCIQWTVGHIIGRKLAVSQTMYPPEAHKVLCCTAGIDLQASTLQQRQHSADDDAGSVASGFSAASTADGVGSLYDVHQHSPAALFMSPSASFGDNDGSAGYEPTMSPGAFQAAMAAGILAAQDIPSTDPKQKDSRVCQPSDTTQHSAASAVHEVPVLSIIRTGMGLQDNPPTPSSVASNSAVSMPASRPGPAASFSSADASSRCQPASETPVSKQTGADDIAGGQETAEQAAEDPASPSAAMSSNALADDLQAELHRNTPSETDEADSRDPAEPRHARLKQAQAQLPESAASVRLRETAQSETPGTETVDSKPASKQMAEIAVVSGLADGSEQSVTPAAAADDAESALPMPAGQPSEKADSCQASATMSVGAANSKSLFSAVSKRPAEVCN